MEKWTPILSTQTFQMRLFCYLSSSGVPNNCYVAQSWWIFIAYTNVLVTNSLKQAKYSPNSLLLQVQNLLVTSCKVQIRNIIKSWCPFIIDTNLLVTRGSQQVRTKWTANRWGRHGLSHHKKKTFILVALVGIFLNRTAKAIYSKKDVVYTNFRDRESCFSFPMKFQLDATMLAHSAQMATVTDVFHGFSQSLHANAEIIL
jgi:hypothetical protein